MGKYQEEKKTPIIMVKKRRTLLPPSLSEKTGVCHTAGNLGDVSGSEYGLSCVEACGRSWISDGVGPLSGGPVYRGRIQWVQKMAFFGPFFFSAVRVR